MYRFLLTLLLLINYFVVHIEGYTFSNTARLKYKLSVNNNQIHRNKLAIYNSQRTDDYAKYMQENKRWGGPIIGPIVRYLNSVIVGVLFSFIFKIKNKFTIHGKDLLLKYVFKRNNFNKGKKIPLLTVSNHKSMLDDPGLWTLLPFFFLRPNTFRWVFCTEDIFFANKYLSKILAAGNTIPLDRFGSITQPMVDVLRNKLLEGSWCHIFIEGRVWQDWRFQDNIFTPRLGPLKLGAARLIAHGDIEYQLPLVIPMYHKGLDQVFPEVVIPNEKNKDRSKAKSFKPQGNNHIELYIGDPINFTPIISQFREKHPGMLENYNRITFELIELYIDITRVIKAKMIELETKAYKNDRQNAINDASYCTI